MMRKPRCLLTSRTRAGKANLDLLLVGGMLLGWVALQTFVLPGLGVST